MPEHSSKLFQDKFVLENQKLEKLQNSASANLAMYNSLMDYHNIPFFELNNELKLENYNTPLVTWFETNNLKLPVLGKLLLDECPFLPQLLFNELIDFLVCPSTKKVKTNFKVNKSNYYVIFLINPIINEKGQTGAIVSILEMKSVENEFPVEYNTRKVLYNILKNFDFHIVVFGLQGEIIIYNQAVEKFFIKAMNYQMKPGHILRNKLDDEEFIAIWKKNEAYCLEGNESRFLSSVKIAEKNYQFEFSFFPFKNNDNIVGYSVLVNDLTHVNRIEKKLFLSEERYCDLVEKAEVGIAFDNKAGEITFFNEKFCELFGYNIKEMIGKCHQDLVDPHCIDKIRTYHNSRLAGDIVPMQYCFKGLKKDGSTYDAEIIISEIINKNGTIIGTRNYFWDVTHREKIKSDLKRHKTQLELITKILRHDLINNFSAIRSAVRLYKRTGNESMLEAIMGKTEAGVMLIQQMRELESLLSSDKKLEKHSTSKIFLEVKEHFPELDIEVSGESKILVDSGIFSLFQNLINNSVVHGEADKIEIKIKIDGVFCEISLQDNGKGIPSEHREHIFQLNYSTKNRDHSGLGLYIVTQLIERYEGTIKLGKSVSGTLIKMRLPR